VRRAQDAANDDHHHRLNSNRGRGSVLTHAFTRLGPHALREQPIIVRAPLGVSPVGDPVELQLEAYVPAGAPPNGSGGKWPLALLSPGFLLTSAMYRTTAVALARWGWAVVLVDVLADGLLDDTMSAVRFVFFWVGWGDRGRGCMDVVSSHH
jgi:hypothetical protein